MKDTQATIVTFTRHQITADQKEEMERIMSEEIEDGANILDFTSEATKVINGFSEAEGVVNNIVKISNANSIWIFGVIPPIMRAALFESESYVNTDIKDLKKIWLFEAYNINRAEEGDSPKFQFSSWQLTGYYRWKIR